MIHAAWPRDDRVEVTLSLTLFISRDDSVTMGEAEGRGALEADLRAISTTRLSVVVKATSASVPGLRAKPDTRQFLASLMWSLTLTQS